MSFNGNLSCPNKCGTNSFCTNLYSNGKMKLKYVKTCKNEAKLNEAGKKNVY